VPRFLRRSGDGLTVLKQNKSHGTRSSERVTSAIVDLIHGSVATKADIAAVRSDLRDIAAVRTDVVAARGEAALIEHRLLTRLGGLMVVVAGALFAALRYWPPVGHG
jgi:hypothetical protein